MDYSLFRSLCIDFMQIKDGSIGNSDQKRSAFTNSRFKLQKAGLIYLFDVV
jgi:hypothetical protein